MWLTTRNVTRKSIARFLMEFLKCSTEYIPHDEDCSVGIYVFLEYTRLLWMLVCRGKRYFLRLLLQEVRRSYHREGCYARDFLKGSAKCSRGHGMKHSEKEKEKAIIYVRKVFMFVSYIQRSQVIADTLGFPELTNFACSNHRHLTIRLWTCVLLEEKSRATSLHLPIVSKWRERCGYVSDCQSVAFSCAWNVNDWENYSFLMISHLTWEC